ncbi:hypothetical protein H072_1525 [Dactylellina haptotyla CBS 200.50]|uniref:MINDY deubiquitinase domain-containing protein n=1 Tax=Dactylellina haptotyla (strain CBS 200.50) TaxID=1284197 RepID=S8ANQ4_DACHA|nr:hypothetical protein H072_1525 [Dactylellina haptotyla CBS 200.50]
MVTLEQPFCGDPGSYFDGPRDPARPPTTTSPLPSSSSPSSQGIPLPPPAPVPPTAFNLQPMQDALPDHNPYRLLQKQRTGQSDGSYPNQTSYLSTSAGAATGRPNTSPYLLTSQPNGSPSNSADYAPTPPSNYHSTAPRSLSVSAVGNVLPQPLQPISTGQDGIFQMDGDNQRPVDPFLGDIPAAGKSKSAEWWESPGSSPSASPTPGNIPVSLEEQLENEFHRGKGLIAQVTMQQPTQPFQQTAPLPVQQQPVQIQQPVQQPTQQPLQYAVPPQPIQQQFQHPYPQPQQQPVPQRVNSDPFGPAPVPPEPPHPPKVPEKEPQQSLLDVDDQQTGTDKELAPDHSTAPIPVSTEPTARPPGTSVQPAIPLETYQIKHVRFLNPETNKLAQSSILIQNENGPCPLIALVNVLSLSRETLVLAEGLRIRETLSLELLLNVVCEELVLTGSWTGDLSELFKFLMGLRTGMNVNPKFVTDDVSADDFLRSRNIDENRPLPQPKPGDFEQTRELVLYSAFNIPLVHGWLPAPTSPMFPVLVQHARDFEKAQDIIIQQQFILEKSSRGETISAEDSEIVAKAHEIQEFLESTGTQLTSYGLNVLQSKLALGSWSIFFRNDHFSALYKHAKTGELYTLVTDSGYASYEEIVWESLVDGTGRGGAYFSGDFRPVGQGHGGDPNVSRRQSDNILDPNRGDAGWQQVPDRRSSRQQTTQAASTGQRRQVQSLIPPQTAPIVPPDTGLDTTDYDLALAIHLQQEEEERAARIQQNRQNLNPSRIQNLTSANQPPVRSLVSSQPPSGGRPRSSSNYRPSQPPRPTGRQAEELRTAAARSSGQEEIPPPYAAADPNPTAFLPPADPPGPGALGRHASFPIQGSGGFSQPNQSSAYSQMNSAYGSGSQYPGSARSRHSSGRPVGVQQEEDKKCVVM